MIYTINKIKHTSLFSADNFRWINLELIEPPVVQQTHDVQPPTHITLHTLIDKVLGELVTVVLPLQSDVILDFLAGLERAISSDEAVNKTPDSPNGGWESVVLLLSVVLRRQVNVCPLVGGVGFW